MEKFQVLRQDSLKNYQIADHILNVTYPLIKDTKLLVGVADNLFLSLTYAMSSILHYDRIFKLVPPFQDNFESKFNAFRHKCVRRYQVNPEHINLINEIKEIIVLHKKSPVEFRHKDRFIICTKNYQIKAITSNQLKIYLTQTRQFLNLMAQITSRNEKIFKNIES